VQTAARGTLDDGAVGVVRGRDYEGVEVKAWFSDAKFGKEFHKDLEKMAVVGDKRWNKWITSISKYTFSGQAMFFNEIDLETAWMWLRE